MKLLRRRNVNSLIHLDYFQIAAFYIEKKRRRHKMSTAKIHKISEHIRQIRCELSPYRKRTAPWKKLNRIYKKRNLSNGIYEDYLAYTFSIFLDSLINSRRFRHNKINR